MSDLAFTGTQRVDAADKVKGAALFGADRSPHNLLHAALAVASIVKGRVEAIDVTAARAQKGVRDVLTHETIGELNKVGFLLGGGPASQSIQPMLSNQIAYRGQPVALVVAETLEAAVAAASLIKARYTAEPFTSTIDGPGATVMRQADTPLPQELFGDTIAGNAIAAWEAAVATVDATYRSPPQHQNPMELIATVAQWDGDQLTIYEGTQNSSAVRNGVAAILGIDTSLVTVISPYVGGGFGQKNSLQMQTALVAAAAKKVGAPVKLVVSRAQLFHDATFRPASIHRVRLGANEDGKVVAALYDVDSQTSRHDLFPADYTDAAARLHGIPNFQGLQRLVQTDVQTPGYMRAPYEHFASFAMESAMDEMAYILKRDPVAFRIAHDTKVDTVTGMPLSSRHLAECLERGADLFGWSRRVSEPRSMTADNGDLQGWGVAVGCYKAATAAAIAKLTVKSDGRVIVSVGVHEMGQGVRTALAAVVSEILRVPADAIDAVIGDTRGSPQHLTAGSWGTATAIPAALAAARKMLGELQILSAGNDISGSPADILKALGRDELSVEAEHLAPGQPIEMLEALKSGNVAAFGPLYNGFVSFSYIAHFVEVHVEPSTMRVRVPRVVSVADCGRVVSPRTAESQVRGGVVWGIGAALREASETDNRYGGFLNSDMAEYLIPVNADVGTIEVSFINEPDPLLNQAGVKGLGEVVMTGVAPAIGNAIFHATGKRLRDLPIRLEHLL
jgi:xanthine dehydrogenase YagR molybdenum-binding subunit